MSKPLVQSTGRRKRAVARVRVRAGSGQVIVNGRAMDDYFPSRTHRMQVLEPMKLTETAEVYDIDITLHGGAPQARPAQCAWALLGRSSSSTPSCAHR